MLEAALGSAVGARATSTQATPPPAAEHEHAAHIHPRPERPVPPRVPAVLCRVADTAAVDVAYAMLVGGQDTLEAALKVTTAQEDDPNDRTAGLGALPTADGEVELDALCLHGPSARGASVACITGIRNVSLLARAAMGASWPLRAGRGAEQFVLAHGFRREQILTARSERVWKAWKSIQKTAGFWGPGVRLAADAAGGDLPYLPTSQEALNDLVRRMEPLAVKAGLEPQWTWRTVYDALFPAAEALYVATPNVSRELAVVGAPRAFPGERPVS